MGGWRRVNGPFSERSDQTGQDVERVRRCHLDLDDVPLRSVLCEPNRHLERDNFVRVKKGEGGGASEEVTSSGFQERKG